MEGMALARTMQQSNEHLPPGSDESGGINMGHGSRMLTHLPSGAV
jgi:hypothetical protein